MTDKVEKLEEMEVFKCPDCGGSRRVIKDWNAHNQCSPYTPIGFSEKAAERQREYYKRAYGDCNRCKGKGFILELKNS